MDERLKFVAEYLRGDRSVTALCRTFGISRKTGYKTISRYADEGLQGLFNRSRAPHQQANVVSDEVFGAIVGARRQHPHWGPRKLLAWLEREEPRTERPVASTIGRILVRQGLIVPRRRSRHSPPYTEPFQACDRPNAVWCADLKGWFHTADGSRCEPLTVTDAYSRYLLRCQSLPRVTHTYVRPLFEHLFREYGLPGRSALITVLPLPPRQLPAYRGWRCGGSDSVLFPNESRQDTPNKMAATNASIAP